jgi:hypothetical protein
MYLTASLIALALLAGVYAVVLALLRRRRGKEVYVLGGHLAAVHSAEQRRLQSGEIPKSPMPAGTYDFWRGEQSLIDPVKNSLDSALRELCRSFAETDEESRTRMRESISMDEFYTLCQFSKRAAVFAIREHDVDWMVNGLTAIAMIEQERTDFRDVLWALAVLYHSAKRNGVDPDALLRNAAAMSEPSISELIGGFIRRPLADKDLQVTWGYDEVTTSHGIGLIGRSINRYGPNCDLKKVALEIAEYVTTDKYQPASVEIATELPAIWLASKDNRALDKILKAASGTASINAQLRPNEHPSYESQILLVFVVETENDEAARSLLEMCVNKKPSDYCMAGVSEGRLFCLIVARSFVEGIESFETSESLARFPRAISPILRRYVEGS